MRNFHNLEINLARLKWHLAAHNFQRACNKFAAQLEHRYRPDQPRVPAGNPDGGQWTTDPRIAVPSMPDPQTSAPVGKPQTLAPIMSDANPDLLIPGAQYAQTEIRINPGALTGISTIDDTTKTLTNMLARTVDAIDYLPDYTPQKYGIVVHTAFAGAVLLGRLPGIGAGDVETTFGGDYYGAENSVRTDVVLRNEVGDIVAIYDVKTGNAGITPSRAAELRAKTGTGFNVPIIELNIRRGVIRKNSRLEMNFKVTAARAFAFRRIPQWQWN